MVLNLKLIRARTENAKRKWEILLYDLRHFGSKEEENVEVSKFFCKRYFEPKIGLFWAVVKANQMWRKRCRFYAKSHILKTSRPPSQLWQEASLKNPTKWLINQKKVELEEIEKTPKGQFRYQILISETWTLHLIFHTWAAEDILWSK